MTKKKKYRYVSKNNKRHPLFFIFSAFLGVLAIALLVTGVTYTNGAHQEVAGAQTKASDAVRPSITPTISPSCVIVRAVVGQKNSSCSKDAFTSATVICGDGTTTHMNTRPCQSLTALMTQVALVCTGHSLCTPLPFQPHITGTIKPKGLPTTSHPISSQTIRH